MVRLPRSSYPNSVRRPFASCSLVFRMSSGAHVIRVVFPSGSSIRSGLPLPFRT